MHAHENAPPEALSVEEACRTLKIGKTNLYSLIASGSLKAKKCGRRTLILRTDLMDFLTSLPMVDAPPANGSDAI
jgi:excisionase family DNA binding protein